MMNLLEMESAARARLESPAFDYFAGGAGDERTLAWNRDAWDEIALRPRVLRGAGGRDTTLSLLGAKVALPVLAAPTAFQGLAHPLGEQAAVAGVAQAGSIMILSCLSNTRLETIAAAAPGRVWFQLYVYKDRAVTAALARRAEAAGCQALVITVDVPTPGRRERDFRNQFRLPTHLELPNVADFGLHKPAASDERAQGQGSMANQYMIDMMDDALTWDDLGWLIGLTSLPVFVKGVLRADDAVEAVARGAAGVIVSNHGGRQLDTALATARALPAIADAIAGRAMVLVDGGVRRGVDVLKAMALGARAVLIGRPLVWGLTLEGAAGVARVFQILRDELRVAMALCGCQNLTEITSDLLA